jgi:hypothetical protein
VEEIIKITRQTKCASVKGKLLGTHCFIRQMYSCNIHTYIIHNVADGVFLHFFNSSCDAHLILTFVPLLCSKIPQNQQIPLIMYKTVTHRENNCINAYSTIRDLNAIVAHGTKAIIDKMIVIWPALMVTAYCKYSENHCTGFREYYQCYLYIVNFVILIVNVRCVGVPAALPPGKNPLNTSGWSLQPVWSNNANKSASSLSSCISKCLLFELILFGRHIIATYSLFVLSLNGHVTQKQPRHGSGGHLPVSHCQKPGSIPMCDLWWTKW